MAASLAQLNIARPRLCSPVRVRLPGWLVREVILPCVLTRLALSAVGLVANSGNFLATWASWDGSWYLSIAQVGYDHHNEVGQPSVAFAPLLPGLMRLFSQVLGVTNSADAVTLCGFVIVNLALLVALGYLVALVRDEFDAPTASRTALYALVFPTTLFLSAVYPHALFLAGAIGAFYYARHGQWWLAGALGAVAALARLQGCAIVLPLAFEYFSARGFSLRHLRLDALKPKKLAAAIRLDALALLLPLASFGVFATILWLQVGSPLAMLSAQGAWNRHFGAPWSPLLLYVTEGFGAHGSITSPLDLAFTLLLTLLVGISWTRVRPSLALFATLFLLINLSSGQLSSGMRFGLELFPIFIVLAISGRFRAFHYAYLAAAGYMALRFMSEFAQNIWVA